MLQYKKLMRGTAQELREVTRPPGGLERYSRNRNL